MTPERRARITRGLEELNPEEIAQGWHLCHEWDGLLVGPGCDELQTCQCQPAKGAAIKAIETAIIERALHFVENDHVLRELRAGKSWSKAFGEGGGTDPVYWVGDAKGIKYEGGLITPRQIAEYVKAMEKKQMELELV